MKNNDLIRFVSAILILIFAIVISLVVMYFTDGGVVVFIVVGAFLFVSGLLGYILGYRTAVVEWL